MSNSPVTPDTSCPLPSDDEIRRLLAASRADSDPRASASVSLLLFATLRLRELRRLSWPDVDFSAGDIWVRCRNGSSELLPMPNLLTQQLLAVRGMSAKRRVFAASERCPMELEPLLERLLSRAGLSSYHLHDLTRWSFKQTPETRKGVATS